MRPSALLCIEDPIQALDFDLALATRARYELKARIEEASSDSGSDEGFGGFFAALLMMLSE